MDPSCQGILFSRFEIRPNFPCLRKTSSFISLCQQESEKHYRLNIPLPPPINLLQHGTWNILSSAGIFEDTDTQLRTQKICCDMINTIEDKGHKIVLRVVRRLFLSINNTMQHLLQLRNLQFVRGQRREYGKRRKDELDLWQQLTFLSFFKGVSFLQSLSFLLRCPT